MSGFLKFIDNTLGTNFDAPRYNPKLGRKKMVRVIDLAARQHSEGSTRAPNRSWTVGGNDAIRFAPKINGKPVKIGGEVTNYVPAEHFQDFLSGLKAFVEAGDLDDEIKEAIESKDETEGAATASKSKGKAKGDKFPKHLHPGYGDLGDQQKRNLGRWWSMGRNPDQSLRAEVGDKPDAPYTDA